MNERRDGWMDEWMRLRLDEWERMDEWIRLRLDEWEKRWMNGWMNEIKVGRMRLRLEGWD